MSEGDPCSDCFKSPCQCVHVKTPGRRPKDTGRKDDQEKLRWELLPFNGLEKVVRVLGFGARKYGDDNWRKVPNGRRRYAAAALRHLVAYLKGEINDPESGEPHLAHLGCCVLFLLEDVLS